MFVPFPSTQGRRISAPSFVRWSSTAPLTPLPPSHRRIRSSSVVPYSSCSGESAAYRRSTSRVAPLCRGGGEGDTINGADIDPLEAGPDVYPFEYREPSEEDDEVEQSTAMANDLVDDDYSGEQGMASISFGVEAAKRAFSVRGWRLPPSSQSMACFVDE